MRKFQGNGFSILLPESWVDRTVYVASGPTDGNFMPCIRVIVDRDLTGSSAKEYADQRLNVILKTIPACRLLQRDEISLYGNVRAERVEICQVDAGDLRLYERYLFVSARKQVCTVCVQITKELRASLGQTIDGILASWREAAAERSDERTFWGVSRLRGDWFTLDLPAEWTDETAYYLTEPDESQFCRNLVIRRDRWDQGVVPIGEVAREETELMRSAVPGFELLDVAERPTFDGAPAARLTFVRSTTKGARIQQSQILALRNSHLYTISLTTEDGPLEEIRRALFDSLDSFACESGKA